MGRYSVKRYKTKRYTRDLDQILHDDLSSDKRIESLKVQELDETKPGLGQFYCIPCAKYFETQHARSHHVRGQIHKRRLKDIKAGPYTKEEADAAGGMDVQKYLNKVEQQKNIKGETVVEEILAKPPPKSTANSSLVEDLDNELQDMVVEPSVQDLDNELKDMTNTQV